MVKLPLRRRGDDIRDPCLCAVRGCARAPEYIDATGRIDSVDVPLCGAHWLRLTDDERLWNTAFLNGATR